MVTIFASLELSLTKVSVAVIFEKGCQIFENVIKNNLVLQHRY